MSAGLGLSREGQNSGGEGEHKVSPCMGFRRTLHGSPSSPRSISHIASLSLTRTLCDNLRRERDRAVSDLADALRNLDDMRKQKNDALRELKEIK